MEVHFQNTRPYLYPPLQKNNRQPCPWDDEVDWDDDEEVRLVFLDPPHHFLEISQFLNFFTGMNTDWRLPKKGIIWNKELWTCKEGANT